MAEMTVTIQSYSEEDAIKQALLTFKKVTEIKKVKSGYNPDKAKVIKPKTRVKQSWVTKFYIYTYDSKGITVSGEEVYTGLKLQGAVDTTKQDAIQTAEGLAVQLMKPLTIRMVKVLEEGSNMIAEVLPDGGIMGEWKVTGTLREISEEAQKQMEQNSHVIIKKEEQTCSEKENSQESKPKKPRTTRKKSTKSSTKTLASDVAAV